MRRMTGCRSRSDVLMHLRTECYFSGVNDATLSESQSSAEITDAPLNPEPNRNGQAQLWPLALYGFVHQYCL